MRFFIFTIAERRRETVVSDNTFSTLSEAADAMEEWAENCLNPLAAFGQVIEVSLHAHNYAPTAYQRDHSEEAAKLLYARWERSREIDEDTGRWTLPPKLIRAFVQKHSYETFAGPERSDFEEHNLYFRGGVL